MSRSRFSRTLFRCVRLTTVTVLAGVGLSACSADTTADVDKSKPIQGGSVQFAFSDGRTTDVLDPAKISTQSVAILGGLVFDKFLGQDDQFRPTPSIATSWEVSDDAMAWTFKIREGVQFQDGTPLTAKDVAYSIRRHLDEKVGSALYHRLGRSVSAEGIKVVDPATIRIELTKPDAMLAATLASRNMYIIKDGTTDFAKPIGTGPFKLERFTAGSGFKAVKNKNYWQKGLPYLDSVQGVAIADQASKLRAVTSGKADITDSVDFTLIPSVEANKRVVTKTLPSSFFTNLAMDQTVAPFDDVRVRQAMKLAVDRDLVLNRVFLGHGTKSGDVPVLPTNPGYPDKTLGERDVKKAKQLLAEAGYPKGIDVVLDVAPLRAGMVDMAVVFAESVKEAGIRVKVKQQPAANFYTRVWLKRPFYVSAWATYNPLATATTTLTSDAPSNEARFNSPKFDALIEEAFGTVDEDKRNDLTRQAMELSALESGWIIPAIMDFVSVMKADVQGVEFNTLQVIDFSKAWLAR